MASDEIFKDQYTPEDGIPYELEQGLTSAMDAMRTATDNLAIAISAIEERAPDPINQFRDFSRARQVLIAIRQARNFRN